MRFCATVTIIGFIATLYFTFDGPHPHWIAAISCQLWMLAGILGSAVELLVNLTSMASTGFASHHSDYSEELTEIKDTLNGIAADCSDLAMATDNLSPEERAEEDRRYDAFMSAFANAKTQEEQLAVVAQFTNKTIAKPSVRVK